MDVYIAYTSAHHGYGVFAGRDFKSGELLIQTTGRVLPYQTEHTIQIGWDKHLEVEPPARFLNYACEPNAGARTNSDGLPEFVALKDIARGEEIRYDYAMTEYRHYERASPELDFDLTCHCRSPNCRGKFGYYAELPEPLKEKYTGFILDYLVQPEHREE